MQKLHIFLKWNKKWIQPKPNIGIILFSNARNCGQENGFIFPQSIRYTGLSPLMLYY